jgi:tRNA A37 threonylcarbamoyladenosine dehydratase
MDLSRVAYVIGQENITKLQAAHVAVVGLGGVGSYIAEALARSGVGALTLVDADEVAPSNINRQLPALVSTIGKLKTEVIAERIAQINPDCKVTLRSEFYEPGDFDKFFPEALDFVADAIDSTASKIDLLVECHRRQIPVISSMGTGNKLDPTRFEVTTINKTSVCPLAKVMRRELKKRGITDLKVVYSQEEPLKQGERTPASISFVPPVAGFILAGEVIKDLIK